MKSPIAMARGLHAFMKLVKDPHVLDEVFVVSRTLAEDKALAKLVDHYSSHDTGKKAFAEKRRRGVVDMEALSRLPLGTLGKTLSDYLTKKNLDINDIPTLPSNTENEFVMAHLYETHDIWHVVTGFETDVPGELGLQAFYFAQGPTSLSATLLAAGFLNTALYAMEEKDVRVNEIVRGWTLGKRSKRLFGQHWPDLFHLPLEEVRRKFDLVSREIKPSESAVSA